MNAIAMRARPHRGCRVLLGGALLVCGLTTGCHQPYHHAPYQPGMYQPQYGAPAYGAQPYGGAMYGTPQGQFTSPPGISAVPSDNVYTPAPSSGSTNGGDAPAFGTPGNPSNPSGNNNGVPKYNDPTSDSPYFEQNSMRQEPGANPMAAMARNTPPTQPSAATQTSAAPPTPPESAGGFIPQETAVASAGFDKPQTNQNENVIDLTGEETFQQFEPPMTNRQPVDVFAAAPDQPAESKEPQPVDSPFELAAPPLADAAATPAAPASAAAAETAALEGTAQYQPANQRWVLKFAGAESASAPFGGQLPLTGSPNVLQSLKDQGQFRVHGFLEVSEDPNGESQFNVQRVENLSSPFAQ